MYYKYRFARKACSMIGFCTFFFFFRCCCIRFNLFLTLSLFVGYLPHECVHGDWFILWLWYTRAHTKQWRMRCCAFFSFEVIGCWSIIKLHIVYNHSQFTWYYGNFLLLPKTYQRQLQFFRAKRREKKKCIVPQRKEKSRVKICDKAVRDCNFFSFLFSFVALMPFTSWEIPECFFIFYATSMCLHPKRKKNSANDIVCVNSGYLTQKCIMGKKNCFPFKSFMLNSCHPNRIATDENCFWHFGKKLS